MRNMDLSLSLGFSTIEFDTCKTNTVVAEHWTNKNSKYEHLIIQRIEQRIIFQPYPNVVKLSSVNQTTDMRVAIKILGGKV